MKQHFGMNTEALLERPWLNDNFVAEPLAAQLIKFLYAVFPTFSDTGSLLDMRFIAAVEALYYACPRFTTCIVYPDALQYLRTVGNRVQVVAASRLVTDPVFLSLPLVFFLLRARATLVAAYPTRPLDDLVTIACPAGIIINHFPIRNEASLAITTQLGRSLTTFLELRQRFQAKKIPLPYWVVATEGIGIAPRI
jgi:hypothetical protein